MKLLAVYPKNLLLRNLKRRFLKREERGIIVFLLRSEKSIENEFNFHDAEEVFVSFCSIFSLLRASQRGSKLEEDKEKVVEEEEDAEK